MSRDRPRTILVVGVPRSGSTWVARTLAAGDGAIYLHEPDGHARSVAAVGAKFGLGQMPVVADTEALPPRLARLWSRVMSDASAAPRPSPAARVLTRAAARLSGQSRDKLVRPLPNLQPLSPLADLLVDGSCRGITEDATLIVAKTVHSCMSAGSLAAHLRPDAVVATERPLREVVASWLELDYWPLPPEEEDAIVPMLQTHGCTLAPPGRHTDAPRTHDVERIVWLVGAMSLLLRKSTHASGWNTLDHAAAAIDPIDHFRRLYEQLGLDFDSRVADFIRSSNSVGSTYSTNRVATGEVSKWRSRLSVDTADRVETAALAWDRYER